MIYYYSRILGEKVMELMTEKEELVNTINNLNSIVGTMTARFQEREESLRQEIDKLREYSAKYSYEKFDGLEIENKRLKEEVQSQKRKYVDMETQYRQENQDLMHLYIDAEETKKHILEQLSQIKQTKDRLLQDQRLVDSTKHEILRVLDTNRK
jgi:chromosome segregation ATPase